jgi:hypothetical protein
MFFRRAQEHAGLWFTLCRLAAVSRIASGGMIRATVNGRYDDAMAGYFLPQTLIEIFHGLNGKVTMGNAGLIRDHEEAKSHGGHGLQPFDYLRQQAKIFHAMRIPDILIQRTVTIEKDRALSAG